MGSMVNRPVMALSGWLHSFSPRLLVGGALNCVLVAGCAVVARQAGAPTHAVATLALAAIILQVMLLRWLSQAGPPSASLVQQGLVHQLGPGPGQAARQHALAGFTLAGTSSCACRRRSSVADVSASRWP